MKLPAVNDAKPHFNDLYNKITVNVQREEEKEEPDQGSQSMKNRTA